LIVFSLFFFPGLALAGIGLLNRKKRPVLIFAGIGLVVAGAFLAFVYSFKVRDTLTVLASVAALVVALVVLRRTEKKRHRVLVTEIRGWAKLCISHLLSISSPVTLAISIDRDPTTIMNVIHQDTLDSVAIIASSRALGKSVHKAVHEAVEKLIDLERQTSKTPANGMQILKAAREALSSMQKLVAKIGEDS
jgi:hypothetical protein